MKHKHLKILATIALGGLMACGQIACAQDNPPPAKTPPPPGAPPAQTNRPPGMGRQGLMDKLNLTEDQKTQVTAALKEQRDKMSALRMDTSVTGEDRRAKMKEISDATDAKMKTILTPEQYTTWQSARRPMRAPPGAGGPGAGGPAGAPSKTPPPPQ